MILFFRTINIILIEYNLKNIRLIYNCLILLECTGKITNITLNIVKPYQQ
jgi:hypothetical protein